MDIMTEIVSDEDHYRSTGGKQIVWRKILILEGKKSLLPI